MRCRVFCYWADNKDPRRVVVETRDVEAEGPDAAQDAFEPAPTPGLNFLNWRAFAVNPEDPSQVMP